MKKNFKPALAYHILTPLYDQFNRIFGFGRPFMWRVIAIAELKNGERVLDVGSGTGEFIHESLQKYPEIEITGIDPDIKALGIAQNKLESYGEKARLARGYAQELPFVDNAFDLVVSTLAFHHIPDEVKPVAIKEIKRVLTSHGRFVLADFGKPQTKVLKFLLTIGSFFDGKANMQTNLTGKLPQLLIDEGFTVKEIPPRYRGVQFLVCRKSLSTTSPL